MEVGSLPSPHTAVPSALGCMDKQKRQVIVRQLVRVYEHGTSEGINDHYLDENC